MLPVYEKKSNKGIGFGIVLHVIGVVTFAMASNNQNQALTALGILVILAGSALFIWGCCCYAIGKGHSGALGIVALLGIGGLIILAVIPDKHRLPKVAADEQTSVIQPTDIK